LADDAATLTDEEDRGAVLESWNFANCVQSVLESKGAADCVQAVELMTQENQASALFLMGESKRLKVLDLMGDASRKTAIEALCSRERRRRDETRYGVPYGTIVTDESLESYPESIRKCVVCHGPYLFGQSILGADCGIHSFHDHCEKEEGICPECQHPTDVFPLGNVKYLEKNRLENTVITGLGCHQNSERKYVLVSFHPEKREMYWYELDTAERQLGRLSVQCGISEFLCRQALYR
jgi:hypothetical protein